MTGKKINKCIIALWIFAITVCSFANASEHTDMVESGHWAYDALNWSIKNGIITGFDDGTIRHNDNLTRSQLATIICKSFKLDEVREPKVFLDVSEDMWFFKSINTAYRAGLLNGYDDGSMRPDANATREEAFTVVARMLDLDVLGGVTSFNDDKKISDWARPYIKALKSSGIISGDESGNVNPDELITRAEFVQVIYNIANKNAEADKDSIMENDSKTTSDSSAGQSSYHSGRSKTVGEGDDAPHNEDKPSEESFEKQANDTDNIGEDLF